MARKKNNIEEKPIAKKIEPVDTSFKENKKNIKDKELELKQELTKIKKTKTTGEKIAFIFLSITLLIGIGYLIDNIIMTRNEIDFISKIINSSLITVFTICFVAVGIYSCNRKGKTFVIIASILLSSFCTLQMMETHNLISIPEQKHVLNFTNKSLTEALEWASSNNIEIEQTYEYSDTIKEYFIMYQSIPEGTLLKDISKLEITISNGPDTNKEVIFPSMLGKNVDDVITFVEENYFTNVNINFIYNETSRDIVIDQDKSGALARNDQINITVSLGNEEEITPVEMIDLSNKSLFYAITWCKRNILKYEISYEYSDTISKDYVISHDHTVGENINMNEPVKLVISKGPKIVVPNLMNMTSAEITDWVITNKLKLLFKDAYDPSIEVGKPVSVNVKENDEIEQKTLIEVVISKGPLKLEKYSSLSDIQDWASKYGIKTNESYEFNNDIASGEIISVSKKPGDTISNDETINIVISQGKELTIPNLIGKTKTEASNACKSAGITCSFVYGNYSETVSKDKVTGQSKSAGSKVSASAVLTLTLSRGIIEKVNVPSLVGLSKSNAQSKCSSIGITCNFTYESNYSNIAADTVTRQSNSGSMNKGSSITVYLSKGKEPVKAVCTINIQSDWMKTSYDATVSAIRNGLNNSGKLSSCPNVKFNYVAVPANSKGGIITSDSPIQANKTYNVTDGSTYTIKIYQN